jgi:carbon-monoxide dehydrogenase medium subunit
MVVENVHSRRAIAAVDYFRGLYETARAPDELLVEVQIPVQSRGWVSVFMELARRHGDFAIAGVAFHLNIAGGTVCDGRLVYFASEEKPTLAHATLAALRDKRLDAARLEAAAAALAHDLKPISSPQGSAKLRLYLQRVLTRRALGLAAIRAGLAS